MERYSLESVKQDVKSFFNDDDHWAYKYGSKSKSCHKDSVFYKRQIQIIFEGVYPHDITGKAVNSLIKEGFLSSEPRSFSKNMHAIFIWRHNVRYVARDIKLKASIMEKFSADELNDGAGKYAESLFLHMFQKNQFTILGRDVNMLGDARWTVSDKNLDFIIERDGFVMV